MQSDQQHLRPFPDPPFASFFGQNVDFQPSRICPRNFVIFDRTDNRSQIMYHPGALPAPVQNDVNAPGEVESIMKEDSADIDLLMSFEEEEDEEEEEEVSTARTHKNDEVDTADSCSLRLPGKGSGRGSWLGLSTASCKSSGSSDRKRREMKKMVDSLRGIVPGSKRMNTVDVLDEAVKYLKSLKVELQKVGVADLKN
ncbi:hypothetical protein L2E82_29733 [Cichorium intybus]|uniref:Uncharacterized protein n=1 Tax=Cichorium intybus TaxID=13427 RepID=A0ACB9CYK4_CICIN|nr:hypothetical protein L2E82_29733 [Cichorium intybus]